MFCERLNGKFRLMIVWVGFSVLCGTLNAVTITVQSEEKQQMRYGLDFERLWFWYGPQTYLEDCAQWSVVDCDVDYLRVAINCGYELEEGVYNLSAYTNKIIPMMTTMKAANPNIKFFASPRPLKEAESGADWQPYPRWITGQTYNDDPFDFQWQKCAEYLLRYLELMDSYGFKISYLDVTNEWQSYPIGPRLQPSDVLDIRNYLIANLPAHIEMPLIIAPSAWSCKQGASFVSHAGNLGVEDGFDIAGVHNTGLGYYIGIGYTEEEAEVLAGLPQDFADAVNALDETKEIWDTEVHGWKGTTPASEIPTSYKMFERIRAGFSGLNGWLAIGQTNQKHCYFLNYGSGVTRNVKYYIFQKLTTTSNYGYALDVNLPHEFESTAALIRDDILTIWVLNNSSVDVTNVEFVVNNRIISDTPIKSTQWHSSLSIVGQSDSITKLSDTQFHSTVKANSLYCFEVEIKYIQTHIADLNYDGRIDSKDYCILAQYWHQDESSVDIAPQPAGDGKVDFKDLAFLVEYWLTASTIPPLPAQATNPNPTDNALSVATTANLSWTAGSGATSHDVYIGTSNPPPFIRKESTTTFVPGWLPYQTKFYWCIDEINGWGRTTGQIWEFTTMMSPPPHPGQASNPNPTDGATGVSIDKDLSWTPGSGATSHDVYFGTSIILPFIKNQTAATFDPGRMELGTQYYWRINEKTASGTIVGPIWSFTTSAILPPPP